MATKIHLIFIYRLKNMSLADKIYKTVENMEKIEKMKAKSTKAVADDVKAAAEEAIVEKKENAAAVEADSRKDKIKWKMMI